LGEVDGLEWHCMFVLFQKVIIQSNTIHFISGTFAIFM